MVRSLPRRSARARRTRRAAGVVVYGLVYKDTPAKSARLPRRNGQSLSRASISTGTAAPGSNGALRRTGNLRHRRKGIVRAAHPRPRSTATLTNSSCPPSRAPGGDGRNPLETMGGRFCRWNRRRPCSQRAQLIIAAQQAAPPAPGYRAACGKPQNDGQVRRRSQFPETEAAPATDRVGAQQPIAHARRIPDRYRR